MVLVDYIGIFFYMRQYFYPYTVDTEHFILIRYVRLIYTNAFYSFCVTLCNFAWIKTFGLNSPRYVATVYNIRLIVHESIILANSLSPRGQRLSNPNAPKIDTSATKGMGWFLFTFSMFNMYVILCSDA